MTAPDLTPLSEEVARARAAAAAAAQQAHVEIPLTSAKPRKRKTDKDDDLASVKRAFKKGGEAMAYKVGRAFGLSDDEIAAAIAPPSPPDPPPQGGKDSGKGGARAGKASERSDGAREITDDQGGKWIIPANPIKPLPPDCPVRAIGVSEDGEFFYIDPLNRWRKLAGRHHDAAGLRALFANQIGYLWRAWPKFDAQTRMAKGFQADRASESLMHACAQRGIFDEHNIRGVGAWRADDGALLFHNGDCISTAEGDASPGEIGGYIYPAFPPCVRPAPALPREEGYEDLDALLHLLDTWNWSAPGVGTRAEGAELPRIGDYLRQSYLLLGFIGVAIAGGALAYRPPIWITGDAGSGKSALFALLKQIIGTLVEGEDSSPAYVWGLLGKSSRPVLLDEVENDPQSPRNQNLVKLARVAFSGGKIGRSNVNQEVMEFFARSAFCFSSIIIPPMGNQDFSRFCILDLAPIGEGGLKLDAKANAETGAIIRRLLLARWGQWDERLNGWRASLAAQGHDSRGCDAFGTLLAMADLLLHGRGYGADDRAAICAQFPAARAERTSNHEDMLNLLLSKSIVVGKAKERRSIERLLETVTMIDGTLPEGADTPQAAEEELATWGIFVKRGEDGRWRVALPNKHDELRRLFEGSPWRTAVGMTGGWAQAMRRLPGAKEENSRKLGGRGWSAPAEVFLLREK